MYLSVIIAAAAYLALGMLWYGPLFGKPWMAEMGFSKKNMKSMKMKPQVSMVLGFIGALVTAYALKAFVLVNPAMYLNTAIWIWLGFIAMNQLGAVLWENKSWKLFAINASHSLVSTLIMAWIIVAMA